MKNTFLVQGNKIVVNGFEGFSDFTVSFISYGAVVFPKKLNEDPYHYYFEGRKVDESRELLLVEALRKFYSISEGDFEINFEPVPPEGNLLGRLDFEKLNS